MTWRSRPTLRSVRPPSRSWRYRRAGDGHANGSLSPWTTSRLSSTQAGRPHRPVPTRRTGSPPSTSTSYSSAPGFVSRSSPRRDVNTTVRPSGRNVGADSSSSPGVRQRGSVAPSASTSQMWLRRSWIQPSRSSRYGIRLMWRGRRARSSSSRSARSGVHSTPTTARCLLSGAHARSVTPSGSAVHTRASPPPTGSTASCGRSLSPPPVRRKASRRPSGDQRGLASFGPCVSWRAPAWGSHRWIVRT